jgi:hypothetical protein
MTRIVAYTYCADVHCPACAERHAAVGILTRQPPLSLDTDEHGLALDLHDREGNPVHPVFSTDEVIPSHWTHCGTCLQPL